MAKKRIITTLQHENRRGKEYEILLVHHNLSLSIFPYER